MVRTRWGDLGCRCPKSSNTLNTFKHIKNLDTSESKHIYINESDVSEDLGMWLQRSIWMHLVAAKGAVAKEQIEEMNERDTK